MLADWPRRIASITVQRPVPFCPALSAMTSTIGFPVAGSSYNSTLPVISNR